MSKPSHPDHHRPAHARLESLVVAQSNDLAAAHQALRIHDKRLLLTAISHITMADDHLPTLELDIPTYRELWGLRHNALIQDLKSAVQRLKHATTTISTRDGDATLHLFDAIDIHHGHNRHTRTTTITMRLHDDLAPHLLNLSKAKRGFLKVPLAYYTALRSPAHIRLHELLISQARGKKVFHTTLELPDLCQRLGLPPTTRWAALHRNHIQPALHTLQTAFLLHATAHPVTASRKVTHVQFACDDWSHTWRYPTTHLPAELAEALADIGFDPKHPLLARARNALGDHTVLNHTRDVLHRRDTYGDVDRPAAYLHTVLEARLDLKGIHPAPSSDDGHSRQGNSLPQLADALTARIADHVLAYAEDPLATPTPGVGIWLASETDSQHHLAQLRQALASKRDVIHAVETTRALELPRTPTQLLHLATTIDLLADVPPHQQPRALQLLHQRLQYLLPHRPEQALENPDAAPKAA